MGISHERLAESARQAAAARADADRLTARVELLSRELEVRAGYGHVVGQSAAWKAVIRAATQVAATDTTIWVEKLEGPIASGVAMVMSNGVTLTTSAPAVEGARSISVTSAPAIVAAGNTADVQSTGSGLPLTLSSADYTTAFSNGANKILTI